MPSKTVATAIGGIRETLGARDELIAKLMGDAHLSDAGKRAKRQEIEVASLETARIEAAGLLLRLDKRRAQARERLNRELSLEDGQLDVARQGLALERARLLAQHTNDWSEIEGAVSQAESSRDVYALRAWGDVSGLVRERFAGNEQHRLDAGTLGKRVARALAASERPPLAAARRAVEEAEQEYSEGLDGLGTLRFEASYKGLPTQWLDEIISPRQTVTVETERGGFYVTSEGGVGMWR